jgi:hypothetical protein
MSAHQPSLFDPPAQPAPLHEHRASEAGLQSSADDCLECNHLSIARYMRLWITHDNGSPGTRKRPGMSWGLDHPGPPTAEDRARAHAHLDELGWPR